MNIVDLIYALECYNMYYNYLNIKEMYKTKSEFEKNA